MKTFNQTTHAPCASRPKKCSCSRWCYSKYFAAGGDALIDKLFKNFFVLAGMDTKFGLFMVHRHFDLPEGKKVVEYNGTSTP